MSPNTSTLLPVTGLNTGSSKLAHCDLSQSLLPTAQRNILMTRPIDISKMPEGWRQFRTIKTSRALEIQIMPAEGVFPDIAIGIQSPYWDEGHGSSSITFSNFHEAAELWRSARELHRNNAAVMRAHLSDSLAHQQSAIFGELHPSIVQHDQALDALLEAYKIRTRPAPGLYTRVSKQIEAKQAPEAHPLNQLAALMQDLGDEIHLENLSSAQRRGEYLHKRVLISTTDFASQPAAFLALTTHELTHALCTKLYPNSTELRALRSSVMHSSIDPTMRPASFEEAVTVALQTIFTPFYRTAETQDKFWPMISENPADRDTGCEFNYLKNFELHLALFEKATFLKSKSDSLATPSQDCTSSEIFYVKLDNYNLILVNAPCSPPNQIYPATFQFTFPGQKLISTQAVVPKETPIPIENLTVKSQQEVLAACKESFERARNRVKILREIQQKQKELKFAVNQNPTMYNADELFRIGLENAALLPEAALVIKSYPKVFDLLLQAYKQMAGLDAAD